MSHLALFSELLFDVVIESTIKKMTSPLIKKKRKKHQTKNREVVRVAKEAQDSLDKDSTFKERHRKKRDGQEARDKDRRPKKEAEETLFNLKHGQLRTKRCAAGNADSAKVCNRDFLVRKAKEEHHRRRHYRLLLELV